MKEKFENAEVEVIRFEKDDVITTSGYDHGQGNQPPEPIPEDD